MRGRFTFIRKSELSKRTNAVISFLKVHIAILFLLSSAFPTQDMRICIRVKDGDTILLDGNETVRLIGVDCPESKDPYAPVQFFAKEAYLFTKRLVERKNVRIEFDRDEIDVYGRTLAYVYLADGTFINAEIIKQGYGYAYTQFPFKYKKDFLQYEKRAKKNNLGLWAPTEPNISLYSGKTVVYITRRGKSYHKDGCSSLSRSKIPISLEEAKLRGFKPCSRCRPVRFKMKNSTTFFPEHFNNQEKIRQIPL